MANYLCDDIVNKAWNIHKKIVDLGWLTCWFNKRIVTHNILGNGASYPIISYYEDKEGSFVLMEKKKAEYYPAFILKYYIDHIASRDLNSIYRYYSDEEIHLISSEEYSHIDGFGIKLLLLNPMNSYKLIGVEKIEELTLKIKGEKELHVNERLENLLKAQQEICDLTSNLYKDFQGYQNEIKNKLECLVAEYNKSERGVCNYINFLLLHSLFGFNFSKNIESDYTIEDKSFFIDYTLPNKDDIPTSTITKSNRPTELSSNKQKKLYDDIIYAIVLRTLAEILHYDEKNYINHICFNGKIVGRSPFTGQTEEKYILSIHVSRQQIESLNLEYIDPKECFKHLKGVSASKLFEQTEIRPIITPSFKDKRIVKAKDIDTDYHTNLAEMDWEEFEHLVRQVFEWEFSDKGGEVNVTQSSRDGVLTQ